MNRKPDGSNPAHRNYVAVGDGAVYACAGLHAGAANERRGVDNHPIDGDDGRCATYCVGTGQIDATWHDCHVDDVRLLRSDDVGANCDSRPDPFCRLDLPALLLL